MLHRMQICDVYTSEQDHKEFIKAARDGDSTTIERLIDVVDINQVNQKGSTPLGLACINGHRQIVETLLSSRHIDVNKSSTACYYTPLYIYHYFLNITFSQKNYSLIKA